VTIAASAEGIQEALHWTLHSWHAGAPVVLIAGGAAFFYFVSRDEN
jgi:hypothetical protein